MVETDHTAVWRAKFSHGSVQWGRHNCVRQTPPQAGFKMLLWPGRNSPAVSQRAPPSRQTPLCRPDDSKGLRLDQTAWPSSSARKGTTVAEPRAACPVGRLRSVPKLHAVRELYAFWVQDSERWAKGRDHNVVLAVRTQGWAILRPCDS